MTEKLLSYTPVPTRDISVLLPTRGRPQLMFRSLQGLVEKAVDTSSIEFLVAIDNDDKQSYEFIEKEVIPWFNEKQIELRVYAMDRLGYVQLHKYVNFLGYNSTGRWMLFWNDDAVMESHAWDNDIRSHNGELSILRFKDNHNCHPYSIFPIVPRDWCTLFECLSPAQQTDAWISQVAWLSDSMVTIESEVTHDRYDITGNNNDATFQERVYLNDAESSEMFHKKQHFAAKWVWLRKIAGQDTGWWDHIQEGTVDPWEKMLAMDVNNQMVTINIDDANKP